MVVRYVYELTEEDLIAWAAEGTSQERIEMLMKEIQHRLNVEMDDEAAEIIEDVLWDNGCGD